MRTPKLIRARADKAGKVEEQGLVRPARSGGIMEKLLQIRIEGPEDFSRNVDAYLNGDLNGEKPLADGEDPR